MVATLTIDSIYALTPFYKSGELEEERAIMAEMMEYDLTSVIGGYLDRHLVFPMLEFLSEKKVAGWCVREREGGGRCCPVDILHDRWLRTISRLVTSHMRSLHGDNSIKSAPHVGHHMCASFSSLGSL